MKQKWADNLGMEVDEVDNYIDLNNAKGQGKLHKDGKVMKNSKGEEVMLNGVGLFHLLDYGYMYNEETLSALKYWGVNCVRIPAYVQYRYSSRYDTVTPADRGLETAYDEYIEVMDRIIEIASEQGLYCMVDFHILQENGDVLEWKDLAEKFFRHFGEKYGDQENILYEITNEPFSTPNASLVEYINFIKPIIKEYDANPIIITGYTYESGLRGSYEALKENDINDVFISYHYYNGEDITQFKQLYETTDIPLIYSEWGNSDTKANGTDEYFTEMTTQYLQWWKENNIANCAWMLCHGNYSYSLWNKELGDKSEILQHGVISDKYLSEYGNLVFNSYLNDTFERIKENNTIMTSNTYQINREKWNISKVKPNTTSSEFKEHIEINQNYNILDNHGDELENDELITTGCKIVVNEDEIYTVSVIGDLNNTGTITLTDISLLRKSLIELENLNEEQIISADVNDDNRLTLNDCSKLRKLFLQLENI